MTTTIRGAGSWLVLLAVLMAVPMSEVAARGFQKGASLEAGFRRDNLDWNIAGNYNSPNVLSELTWRDLNIFQIKGELAGANVDHIYFRASLDYGWVLSGENQDSDYAGDNRTLEFSRSINGVDGSQVWDLIVGMGKELPFGEKQRHRIIPQLGLSYHSQNLNMTDGNQVLWDTANAQILDPDFGSVPLGPFAGLRSSYDATWAGPWLGADSVLDLRGGGVVRLRVEQHWAWYKAQANWNLRDDFAHPVSFEHEANGKGWVVNLAWWGAPGRHGWVAGVDFSYQRWRTDVGTDTTYFVDPAPPCNGNCYSEGRLNEVNWTSASVSLILRREM